MTDPRFCPHNETTITAAESGQKSEVCDECGDTVAVHETSIDESVCGSTDTGDGEPCENRVSSEDELCWRHGDD